MSVDGKSDLFGKSEQVVVERAIAEFRSGRPVVITSSAGAVAAMPVDGLTDEGLGSFRTLCAPDRPHLVITNRRARALGVDGKGPVGLAIGDLHKAAAIFALASDTQVTRHL